jgi:hypothetical protein
MKSTLQTHPAMLSKLLGPNMNRLAAHAKLLGNCRDCFSALQEGDGGQPSRFHQLEIPPSGRNCLGRHKIYLHLSRWTVNQRRRVCARSTSLGFDNRSANTDSNTDTKSCAHAKTCSWA